MKKTFRIFTKIYSEGEFKIVSRERLFEKIQENRRFSLKVNGLTEDGWITLESTNGKTISSPDSIKDLIKNAMSRYSKDDLCDCYDIEVIS